MNARTSILAAANPIFGRYDKSKNLQKNINISPPIMSRFDLFFVICDESSQSHDSNLCEFMIRMHREKDNALSKRYDTKTIRFYMSVAKKIKPRLTREAAEKGFPLDIHIIYGSRDPRDMLFGEELEALAAENPRITVDTVISEPPEEWRGLCGFINREMISDLVGPVEGKTFFICGPPEMHPLCGGALEALGVPPRLIRREAYGPPADVTLEPGWPSAVRPDTEFEVVEERCGRSLKARAAEPLMNALEREGILLPALCRAGECGACRTRLVSGEVFAPERVGLRYVDMRSGYIHPCMSYPIADLRIRI